MSTATATAPTPVGVSKEHITKTPGVCGGKACIAGTRIRVMDVVYLHEGAGKLPAEITTFWEGVTLSDVYAALSYALDHRAEIDAEFERDRLMDEYGKTQPSKLREAIARDPELQARLDRARG